MRMSPTTTATRGDPTDMSADIVLESSKQYAIRHAAAIAAASVEKMMAYNTSPADTVVLSRQLNELQQIVLKSESAFLDTLVDMDGDQKLRTLFDLFDKDGSGKVSAGEMARGLAKIDGEKSFNESLKVASASIVAYDIDGDGLMDLDEFGDFMIHLMGGAKCGFSDFAQYLALKVGFANHGTAALDDAVVTLVQDSTGSAIDSEDFQDAVVEVRMIMLYQLLDWRGIGKVSITDVLKSLGSVVDYMDPIPREALLMCSEHDASIAFDYLQFSSLLHSVLLACSLTIHEIANMMTLTVCKTKSRSLGRLFQEHDMTELAVEPHCESDSDSEVDDALQNHRMKRLFDLWDLDHSGLIDFSELVLGLRKLHYSKKVDETVNESVAAMMSFDDNKDQQLDRKEFASFLLRFATATSVSLDELIDFMLIEFVMKDNNDEERGYIDLLTKQANASSQNCRGLWSSLTHQTLTKLH